MRGGIFLGRTENAEIDALDAFRKEIADLHEGYKEVLRRCDILSERIRALRGNGEDHDLPICPIRRVRL